MNVCRCIRYAGICTYDKESAGRQKDMKRLRCREWTSLACRVEEGGESVATAKSTCANTTPLIAVRYAHRLNLPEQTSFRNVSCTFDNDTLSTDLYFVFRTCSELGNRTTEARHVLSHSTEPCIPIHSKKK